jgi:hypothetical protein
MSAAEDVREMQTLANEIADYMAGTGALLKQRIGAVLKAINADASEPITDNRALEFLKGRARMVHAWERANADRQLAELKERERTAREHAHFLWLESEIARHRASGQGFRGPHVDGLEHLLRLARADHSAVASADESTD